MYIVLLFCPYCIMLRNLSKCLFLFSLPLLHCPPLCDFLRPCPLLRCPLLQFQPTCHIANRRVKPAPIGCVTGTCGRSLLRSLAYVDDTREMHLYTCSHTFYDSRSSRSRCLNQTVRGAITRDRHRSNASLLLVAPVPNNACVTAYSWCWCIPLPDIHADVTLQIHLLLRHSRYVY